MVFNGGCRAVTVATDKRAALFVAGDHAISPNTLADSSHVRQALTGYLSAWPDDWAVFDPADLWAWAGEFRRAPCGYMAATCVACDGRGYLDFAPDGGFRVGLVAGVPVDVERLVQYLPAWLPGLAGEGDGPPRIGGDGRRNILIAEVPGVWRAVWMGVDVQKVAADPEPVATCRAYRPGVGAFGPAWGAGYPSPMVSDWFEERGYTAEAAVTRLGYLEVPESVSH
jgi:hypothetical protein